MDTDLDNSIQPDNICSDDEDRTIRNIFDVGSNLAEELVGYILRVASELNNDEDQITMLQSAHLICCDVDCSCIWTSPAAQTPWTVRVVENFSSPVYRSVYEDQPVYLCSKNQIDIPLRKIGPTYDPRMLSHHNWRSDGAQYPPQTSYLQTRTNTTCSEMQTSNHTEKNSPQLSSYASEPCAEPLSSTQRSISNSFQSSTQSPAKQPIPIPSSPQSSNRQSNSREPDIVQLQDIEQTADDISQASRITQPGTPNSTVGDALSHDYNIDTIPDAGSSSVSIVNEAPDEIQFLGSCQGTYYPSQESRSQDSSRRKRKSKKKTRKSHKSKSGSSKKSSRNSKTSQKTEGQTRRRHRSIGYEAITSPELAMEEEELTAKLNSDYEVVSSPDLVVDAFQDDNALK